MDALKIEHRYATESCHGKDRTIWLGVTSLKEISDGEFLKTMPRDPKNLFEFLRNRTDCIKCKFDTLFDTLAAVGFFDELVEKENRAVICENSGNIFASINVWRKKEGEPAATVRFRFPTTVSFANAVWSEREMLEKEHDILGFWREHPVTLIPEDTPDYAERTQLDRCKDRDGELIVFASIDKLAEKKTKNKKPYLALDISDETETLSRKIRENVLKRSPELKAGDLVKLCCEKGKYQGEFQLDVRAVELVA